MAQILEAIGLIGPIASGKTTIARLLGQQGFGNTTRFPFIEFDSSSLLDQMCVSNGIEPTRENKQLLAAALEAKDPTAITKLLHEQMVKTPLRVIVPVIDSIRSEEQIDEWRKLIPSIRFVYMETPENERFQRYNRREMKHGRSPITISEFDKVHRAKCDNNIERLKEFVATDDVIRNNSSIHYLRTQAVRLLYQTAAPVYA